jgi:predicted RecA/RadA family phage recombinase
MAKFHQRGERMTFTASADQTAGDVILVGAVIGMVVDDTASGDKGVLIVDGVVSGAPSDTGAAWSLGDQLYWDGTNKKFTKTATSNTACAKAAKAKASADSTCTVWLNR